MNRAYKILFNRHRGVYTITDENHASQCKKKALASVIAVIGGVLFGGGGVTKSLPRIINLKVNRQ